MSVKINKLNAVWNSEIGVPVYGIFGRSGIEPSSRGLLILPETLAAAEGGLKVTPPSAVLFFLSRLPN